jgi:hypothetical protein
MKVQANNPGGIEVEIMARYDVTVELADGNAFAIIGAVSRGLQRAGLRDEATQFRQDATMCKSYDELLQLVISTVEVS